VNKYLRICIVEFEQDVLTPPIPRKSFSFVQNELSSLPSLGQHVIVTLVFEHTRIGKMKGFSEHYGRCHDLIAIIHLEDNDLTTLGRSAPHFGKDVSIVLDNNPKRISHESYVRIDKIFGGNDGFLGWRNQTYFAISNLARPILQAL